MSNRDETLTKSQSLIKKFVDVFWPIENSELKKFLPMSFMLMMIIFVYTLLRGTKDAALIPLLGAEMISTLKLWGVLPSAIIFMVVYTKLASVVEKQKLFYILLSFFVMFFGLYGFVMYPMQQELHIDLSNVRQMIPVLKLPLLMIENWTLSLLYIMSELWGSVMLSLLFWQFANQTTPVGQAKRFYALFGLLGQLGMLAASQITMYIAEVTKQASEAEDIWGSALMGISLCVIIAGLLIAFAYFYINKFVLTDKKHYDPEVMEKNKGAKKKKVKLSIKESFKYIFTSKYLGLIASLVIAYGISINLVEAVWKSQISLQFPQKVDYFAYMGRFQSWTALATMVAMLAGANIIRRVSWFTGAMITPVAILITGGLFFVFTVFRENMEPYIAVIGSTALMMSVILGAIQNILSKSIKYSAFDATKEMSYIPLDDELKMKGKAAVDVVGARLGKSGGAAIQQVFFLTTGLSLSSLNVEMFGVFLVIMVFWIYSVGALSKEFEKKNK